MVGTHTVISFRAAKGSINESNPVPVYVESVYILHHRNGAVHAASAYCFFKACETSMTHSPTNRSLKVVRASVNLHSLSTKNKEELVSGNYWHTVKHSGNNYAGSQAHHHCRAELHAVSHRAPILSAYMRRKKISLVLIKISHCTPFLLYGRI